MIISPPFLPQSGLTSGDDTDTDPMMMAVEAFEPGYHGVFPVTFDRRWHGGIHLVPATPDEPVRAIADGEVVAYRISQNPISDGHIDESTGQEALNTNNGFVLLRHITDTGDGRTITFYSLYMHLLDLTAQHALGVQQPANPPQNTSPTALAAWLLQAGDSVKQGSGKKVHRKDILGHWGQSQGLRHLHFEVFMSEEDFTAWFDQSGHSVQLGEKNPVQPKSADWWGHAYFVIPATADFVARPGTPHDDPWFPALSAGKLPSDKSKLYAEAYFHKGQRYTRSWLDENGDGNCVLLTSQPVKDRFPDYEYKLYERALTFYSTCPSDGYELLRFGRILAPSPTLNSAQEKTTWVAVPFDANGTQAYVDISKTSVIKLSDADFPFFTGWQKIDSDNAPLDANGLFSYHRLRQLVGDATATAYGVSQDDPKFSLDDQLTYYVQANDTVRSDLAGFVCHTKSEWDPANNDQRYQDLNKPDGYFGKCKDTDPDGYERFTGFLKKLQFMDQVPALAGGKKFWFFHPLAFIRHFRKCGWFSKNEFKALYPAASASSVNKYYININKAFSKYLILDALRQSYFLGQASVESGQLRWMSELYSGDPYQYFRKYEEGKNYKGWLGNVEWNDGGKFRGRGFKQLTGRANYASYFVYRAWISKDSYSNSWWSDCGWWGFSPPYNAAHHAHLQPIQNQAAVAQLISQKRPPIIGNPEIISNDIFACIDTAGFFWARGGLIKLADNAQIVQLTNAIRGDRATSSSDFPAAAHFPERQSETERIQGILS